MIYSTGGVERYIEQKQEVVTMKLDGDSSRIKNTSNRKDLQRGVSYRSFKIIEGDCSDEEDDEVEEDKSKGDRSSHDR